MYHSKKEADKAEVEFSKVFSAHELPADIRTFHIESKTKNILDLLVETALVTSKSEARRLIEQKGVHLKAQGESAWRTVSDAKENISLVSPLVIKVGRRFAEARS
jgi:tyrosyl-tRNA synthetase